MKLNFDQIKKINETNRFIIEWCDFFADHEEDLIFSEERIKDILEEEEDIETIDLLFGGEIDYTSIEAGEFLGLCEEIKSIQIVDKGHIKTELRSYYIVEATDSYEDYIIRKFHDIQINPLDGFEINLISDSLIVGLAATKLEEYDRDLWGTISQYLGNTGSCLNN